MPAAGGHHSRERLDSALAASIPRSLAGLGSALLKLMAPHNSSCSRSGSVSNKLVTTHALPLPLTLVRCHALAVHIVYYVLIH